MAVSESRIDSHRPALLYLYGERDDIDRAHRLGELRLRPSQTDPTRAKQISEGQILPFGPRKTVATNDFLVLSLKTVWSETFFIKNQAAMRCLVIRNTEEFGERLHRAVAKVLPQWAGIDAAVAYGAPSPLGAAFTKDHHLSAQKEWLFAWRPMQPTASIQPIVIQVGSLESICDVRESTVSS